MNLDDLARDAAEEVRRQADSIPVMVPTFSRKTRWLAPAACSAGVVILVTALGLLIRDRQIPPVVTAVLPTTTSVLSNPTSTLPPTTTMTTAIIEAGPRLEAAPSEPHIEVGLNDMTLILTIDGGLVGHLRPGVVGPEFYQLRQRRMTAQVQASVNVPDGCQVDALLDPGTRWMVFCRQATDNQDPTIGVLSADGTVEVIGRIPPGPVGSTTVGHWRDAFAREDGALLAQFSGECEIPHAMFIVDGVASHVSGEGFWDDAPVPNSYAFGWLPDGRALVWTEYETGCGSPDPQPGLYAYDLEGTRELLLPFGAHPFWGRVVTSPPAGVAGLTWLRAQYGIGVFGSDGSQFVTDLLRNPSFKSVAWDLGNGFVYLGEAGDLRWWRPNGDLRVATLDGLDSLTIVDVVDDRGPVVILDDGSALLPIDLTTGELRAGSVEPYLRVEPPHGRPQAMFAAGQWAEVDNEGGLAELVIRFSNGGELLRFEVGTIEQSWAVLHDFDGRRVVVSVEALEPADAPRTVYLVDLECPTCTEVIETIAGDSFDLVGIVPRRLVEVEIPILTGE